MMHPKKPISDFFVPGTRAHLVGIGGVSMCPLAEVLRDKGLVIQGSDVSESAAVAHLRSLRSPWPSATTPTTWGTATW